MASEPTCDPSSGRVYYAHPLTGETRWTVPAPPPRPNPGVSDGDPDDAGRCDESGSSYQTHHESARSYRTDHESETSYRTEYEKEISEGTPIDAESVLSGDDKSTKKKDFLVALLGIFASGLGLMMKYLQLSKKNEQENGEQYTGETGDIGRNTDLQIQANVTMPVPPADP